MQEHGVELLWVKLQDLMTSSSEDSRREALIFFEAVIRGQYPHLVRSWAVSIIRINQLLQGENMGPRYVLQLAYHSTTTETREKIIKDLELLEFHKNFDVDLTKFKN